MKKNQARKKYKDLRDKLNDLELKKLSNQIYQQSLGLKIWNKNIFMIYKSIKHKREVDTSRFLEILNLKSKKTLYPKINFQTKVIDAFLFTEQTKFQINKYGIEEPSEKVIFNPKLIEVVFTPLLSYDTEGNRVGYGAGFYDNFFKKCNPKILKIGLSFFEPEIKIEDTNPNDVKLDFCITPNKIFSF